MVEPSAEAIIQRLHKLTVAVNGCGLESKKNQSHLLAKEGILDALLVLYDECNKDILKKDKLISSFVDKYRSTIHELRRLRVNVNDFEQKKVIGKGHFGVVQVVREKQTGNVYALKTLRKNETLAQQHVTFYEEERDIMAKANSPWITHLQFAFQDEQNLYLLMDFHPGGDLLSLLDRFNYSFTEEMTRFYLAEITVALQVVHSMGYVHRDIKPDNILIDRCGHIKLADFGSAAKLTASKIVRSEMPVGTPDYIAPEVLMSMNENQNGVSAYGMECDFWSLGIMAYEMLYGETPFKGDKVITTYSNIMNFKETLKFPEDEDGEISTDAKQLIIGLLEKATDRFGYSTIIKHKFFLHTDWNNLESVRPPFIPIVTSVDDTSNFEEFEYEQSMPNIDFFKTKQAFSGCQLPFVGFTYVRPSVINNESASLQSSIMNSTLIEESLREPSHLEAELKAKKKELHEAQMKIKSLSEAEQGRNLQQMEKRAVQAEKRTKLLDQELKRLEQEAITRERSVHKLKNDLALEKSQRSQSETKTLEFLKIIKEKWKREEEERVSHISKKLDMYKKTAETLDALKNEALEKLEEVTVELNKVKEEAYKYKKIAKEKQKADQLARIKLENKKDFTKVDESYQKLEETLTILENEKKSNKDISAQLKDLKKENSEYKCIISGLNIIKEDYHDLETEVENLQGELQKYKKEAKDAQILLKEVKNKCILEAHEQVQDIEQQLHHEKRECAQLNRKLQEMTVKLNEYQANRDSQVTSFLSKQEEMESRLQSVEDELTGVMKEKSELLSELSSVSSREDEQRIQIEELESLLGSLKQTLNRLETKQPDHDDQQKLQAQLELQEKQLKTTQESAANSKEQLHIAEEELRKKGKELSDLKLDYRSVQRELKTSQETIQYLRDRSREFRDEVKVKEEESSKWQLREEELLSQIAKIESEVAMVKRSKEEAIARQQRIIEETEEKIKEKEKLANKLEEIQKLWKSSQAEVDKLNLEKRGLEIEMKSMEREKDTHSQFESSLKESVKDFEAKLKNAQSVIESLKEVCTEQDDQLSALDHVEEKLAHFEEEKQNLKREIERLHSEVKATRALLNEEKSLKLFQEKRVKDLESKISAADLEHDGEVMKLQQQIDQIREENVELQTLISEMENEIREISQRERTLEHERMELNGHLELLKEEAAGHIDHIHALKESNFKLTDGLEEAISKGELYKKRIEEVENNLRQLQALLDQKELQMKSTIAQQAKLIDFLQAKTENPPKKKRILSRLFRSSNRDKENGGFMVAHQYRELEDLLAREKAHVKQLSAQLSKAHSEVVVLKAQANTRDASKGSGPATPMPVCTPKQKIPLNDLSNSPSVHESNTKQRMRHKIPHRWQSYLVMRAGRCAGCLGNIPFSSNAVKCQECSTLAHTKCCSGIANTCGLPEAFIHHYSQSCKTSSNDESANKEKILLKGWLRIPRSGKASWEKRFIRLIENELQFFEQEPIPSLKPYKHFNLEKNKIVLVHNSVLMSELPNTTSSELPYVLKIDMKAIDTGLVNPLYFMTSTFEEKQSWIKALETITQQEEASDSAADELKGTIEVETLVTLQSVTPLDVNTVVFLDKKSAIVGAAEGLFSFERDDKGKLKFRARIEGLSSVHQIILVKSVGVAVFVAGKENQVFQNDLQTLTVAAQASQMAKPSLSPKRIDPLISCHLVAANEHSAKRTFMCAAASDRISILVWSHESQTFVVCRQYSTQEPCSCFLFTPSALIVGAERFYKIDLKNFTIEEYLDESDTSLAYAIYGSAQMSSFPVAIIQISAPGKYEEYLLAFYEFGIFVDAQGRRTREFDLKFNRLPVGILFRSPYLFVLHQNSVEVFEIKPESFTKVRGMTFDSDTECAPIVRTASLTLGKPRYVGNCLNSGSIVLATNSDESLDIISIRASFPEDPDSSVTWSINTPVRDTPNNKISCQEISFLQNDVSTCLRSDVSTLSAGSESSNSSLKRTTHFPNFMRASKRSKKKHPK